MQTRNPQVPAPSLAPLAGQPSPQWPGHGVARNVALAYFAFAAAVVLVVQVAWPSGANRAAAQAAFVGITTLLLYAALRLYQHRLERVLASAQAIDARQRAVFEASPHPILIVDEETKRILDVNPAACREYGYGRDAFLRLVLTDLAPGEDASIAPPLHDRVQPRRRTRHRRRDGSEMIVEVADARVDVAGRQARMAFVHDVTDRVRTDEHLRASALAFEHVGDAVAVIDGRGRVLSLNRALSRLTGFDEHDVLGKAARALLHGSPRLLRQSLASTGKVDGEVWLKRRDGTPFLVDLSVRSVRDPEERVTHFVAVARDMSAEKAAEARIHALAYYDTLTGLPNRNLLEDRARQIIAMHERSGLAFALLMVDLDHFKQVNDTLGHVAGDSLLQVAARQIDAAVREADTAARWGGDEFVLLLPTADQDTASRIAQRLQKAMAAPVTVEGRLVALGVSVGIALYPRDGRDFETLLKRAGSAMQRAKDLGRNTFQFYEEPLVGDARERVAIAGALRHAIDGGQQMEVLYQPQFDLATGRLVGFEALVRWTHPTLGEVPPEKFIRIAETNGYMAALGAWVTEQACTQLRALSAAGLASATMSVNVSVVQLHDPRFAERLLEALARAGVAPHRLELEVTESVLLQDREMVLQHLEILRRKGVGVSIDDFGTGYSSLSYLRHLPVNKIKIDRSFVQDMLRDRDAASIVEVIVSLAHTLRHVVVAEGVETPEQLHALARLSCDQAQGFLFGKPMTSNELYDWLQTLPTGSAH